MYAAFNLARIAYIERRRKSRHSPFLTTKEHRTISSPVSHTQCLSMRGLYGLNAVSLRRRIRLADHILCNNVTAL